jgi:hypothetical protein
MARRKDEEAKPAPKGAKKSAAARGRERPVEVVRRRGDEPRKRLPAELEAFAGGDDDALWRRERQRGRVDDPRPAGTTLVPGVANRDARLVGDARVKRLRAAIASGDEVLLSEELADAVRLAVWRTLNVVGFDVFAEAVLGIAADRGRALAKAGAARMGEVCRPADEETVALWMRAESGLLEHAPDARVSLREERLHLDVPLDRAAEGLSGVGRRAAPLAKPRPGADVVVDRPAGVQPLSKIIERDRPRDE